MTHLIPLLSCAAVLAAFFGFYRIYR